MQRFRFLTQSLRLVAAIGFGVLLCRCGGDAGDRSPAPASVPVVAVQQPSPAEAPSQAEPGVARISFAGTVHDFGVISDTMPQNTSFAFTNTGTGKLVITKIKPGCGCTTTTLDRAEFMPGEGSTIDIVFDPFRKSGVQSKPITVWTNARPEPVIKLAIRADIRPLLELDSYIARLGTLQLGQEHTHVIGLSSPDPDLVISGIQTSGPHISAAVIEDSVRRDAAEGYHASVEVTISANAPWGQLVNTDVTLTAHGRPAPGMDLVRKPYTVQLMGALYGDLQPQPPVLRSNESIMHGGPYELSTTLFSTSGTPFKVTGTIVTDTTSPDATARVEQISGNAYRIIVEGASALRPGTLRGFVRVQTDVPGEEALVMPFSATVS